MGEAAKTERGRVGAAIEHVTVELPGETHAAMDLDVVLGAVLERLRCADAGAGGGFGQFGRVGRKRPGAVIAVGACKRRGYVHVGQHVLDRLERADRPAEGDTVERVVAAYF